MSAAGLTEAARRPPYRKPEVDGFAAVVDEAGMNDGADGRTLEAANSSTTASVGVADGDRGIAGFAVIEA